MTSSENEMLCPDPVFVVGCPRSGTSILAWSLHQHPGLWTSGESYVLFELFGSGKAQAAFRFSTTASAGNWLERGNVDEAEYLRYLGVGVNALFTSRSRERRWIDHTPHHVLMASVLVDMFPGSKFLHIMRDGRRVVHSMVNFAQKLQTQTKDVHLPPWATDFAEACRTWRQYVEAGLKVAQSYPTRFHIVRNEDLVARPEATFRSMFEFLDLAPDGGPIDYVKTHRINSSFAGSNDVPPPLTEPWRNWSSDQWNIFQVEAGETLVKCGYASSDDMSSIPPSGAFEVESRR